MNFTYDSSRTHMHTCSNVFLFPFLFHYDSWTHQTDQYHVNNNYSHHTSVCVSLFYFFNNQTTVLIFSNLFIVIGFDLIWFDFITFFYVLHWKKIDFNNKKKTIARTRQETVYKFKCFFCVKMLKKKVISFLCTTYILLTERDRERKRKK